MNKKTIPGIIITGLLAVAMLAFSFTSPAAASQPDFICEEYDSGKIDTEGDPATVTVTAPEGNLISGYCVKAGAEKFFIEVSPPQKTVVVDHPVKDSVSHYSLVYVDAPIEEDPEPTPTPTPTVPPTTPPTEPEVPDTLADTGPSDALVGQVGVALAVLLSGIGLSVFSRRTQ